MNHDSHENEYIHNNAGVWARDCLQRGDRHVVRVRAAAAAVGRHNAR